ncbi:DEAD/DEAH box helicase [Serratia sp. NA_13]|uniref:DEAD/DEAH box helicase n=1 Tax=Serratia sp. NA_13 TaxID=3415658 RepID=UPI004046CF24
MDNDIFNQTFEEYQKCAFLITSSEELGRDRLIQILENRNDYAPELDMILADLVESVGFYPYLEKENLVVSSMSQAIRKETNRSKNIDGKLFHDEQKHLLGLIESGKNIIASAPTSFGKSLLIEELVSSRKYRNILIIQPTLALLDETRKKLTKYHNSYKLIVRTSQIFSENEKGNIFLLTAERVNEYQDLPKIDYLVIDEFYKFSSHRDDERHQSLNNAFLKVYKKSEPKFYFLGPNIDGISPGFSDKYNAVFYKTNYSLVRCNVYDIYKNYIDQFSNLGKKAKLKENVLFELLNSREGEQSIIYCSSPNRARRLAKKYSDYIIHSNKKNITNEISIIEWIEKNISPKWSIIQSLQCGVAFHDGALPRHMTSSIIDYFNDSKIQVLFCTTTIIEGVNTSAKNIIYFDEKKGDDIGIDYFDYSNIRGRAGRLMQHYSGNVYNFNIPPEKETIYIDIPFFEQNPIHEEILINLEPDEVRNKNSPEYRFLQSLPIDEKFLFSKNAINIQGQKRLLEYLRENIKENHMLLSWSSTPRYDQLDFCINLCYDFLLKENEKSKQLTARKLTKVTYDYGYNQNINIIIKSTYDYKMKSIKREKLTPEKTQQLIDDSIKESFYLMRHWFQYKVPKLLLVLNELQKHVCNEYNLSAGNYLFYSSLIENDFIPDNLSILIEYGIPNSAIRKLSKSIPTTCIDDDVIKEVVNRRLYDSKNLIPYEKEIIKKNLL